jgi:hypothetical protein
MKIIAIIWILALIFVAIEIINAKDIDDHD